MEGRRKTPVQQLHLDAEPGRVRCSGRRRSEAIDRRSIASLDCSMESQLAYFGALLVRGSSKELLRWTTQDLQHAMRWAEYWERVVHGMTAVGDTATALETAVDRLRVKFPALRLSVGELGRVRSPASHR
eukprot:COSAG02_NODE_15069_length_1207_cov_12.005360_1_plen_130_part_00